MPNEEQLYYLSLQSLSFILSAGHYLELDRVGTTTEVWSHRWGTKLYDLDESLNRELFTPPSSPVLISSQRMEEFVGSILDRWDEVLRPAAHDAFLAFPQNGEKEWLYFYCYHSIAGVLREFDRLMQESVSPKSEIYQRYQTNRERFDALTEALLKEVPKLENTQNNLLQDIEAKAKLLTNEWRQNIVGVVSKLDSSEE